MGSGKARAEFLRRNTLVEDLEPRLLLAGTILGNVDLASLPYFEGMGYQISNDCYYMPSQPAAAAQTSPGIVMSPPPGQRPIGSESIDTSEYMLGNIYVNVVLMESTGANSTENWTSDEIYKVKTQITQGLDWWEAVYSSKGFKTPLDFNIDFTHANHPVSTSYEPISLSSSQEWLWMSDFLQSENYGSYGTSLLYTSGLKAFNDAVRLAHNADWAYTIFVVDSSADTNGTFTDDTFAYANLGGPKVVMTYDNANWTIDNMEIVTAHETGHIFYALDEYYKLNYSWNLYDLYSGYYNTQNLNAAIGRPAGKDPQVDSIMADGPLQINAYANHTSSPSSLEMIGWKDSNKNHIADVLDLPLTLTGTSGSYDSLTKKFYFYGTSSVQILPNKNPWVPLYSAGNDITLNEVDYLQYRIDGGAWQNYNSTRYHVQTQVFDGVGISVPDNWGRIEIRTLSSESTRISNNVFLAFSGTGAHTPVLTLSPEYLEYTRLDGSVSIAYGLNVQDYSPDNLFSATVQISGGNSSDTLSFVNQNGITGNWNSATGTMTLTGSASLSAYRTTLRSVRYSNAAAAAGMSDRTVTFRIADGPNAENWSEAASMTISFEDPPTISLPTFTKGNDQAAVEDGGTYIVSNWATHITGAGGVVTKSLKFVLATNNDGLFSELPRIDTKGTLTYTLAPDANGVAVVTAILRQPSISESIDSVSQSFCITVAPDNDAPVCKDQMFATAGGTTATLLLNADDLESRPAGLAFSVPLRSRHGTLTRVDVAQYQYVPDAGFAGIDTFVYTATDNGDSPGGDKGWGYDAALTSRSATVKIEVGEKISLDARGAASFQDSNGVWVSVQAKNLQGGAVYRLHSGQCDAGQIAIWGTTGKTSLSISTRNGGTTLDGIEIIGGGLGSINAPTTDLCGTVNIGYAAMPAPSLTMTFDQIRDASIQSSTAIKSITATEWLDSADDDVLSAPSIDSLTIKGSRGSRGDFQANVSAYTLGTISVAGQMDRAAITATGFTAKGVSIGTIKASLVGTVNVNAFGGVGTVSTTTWADGDIHAGWVGSISTGVNAKLAAWGDFGANMVLSGVAVSKLTLGSVNIAGNILSDTQWDVQTGSVGTVNVTGTVIHSILRSAGNIQCLKLGASSGSDFGAGVSMSTLQTSRHASAGSAPTAQILSFTISGLKTKNAAAPAFYDSCVSGIAGSVSVLDWDGLGGLFTPSTPKSLKLSYTQSPAPVYGNDFLQLV